MSSLPEREVSPPSRPGNPQVSRLVSLDAFRGAIILLMASAGFGLSEIARQFPDSSVWRLVGFHTDHVPWRGCALWDLIQPAFMFMVGIALPWSIANRQARGEPFGRMLAHALWRSLLLVLLGVFLSSAWSKQTDWSFTNVLAQIGLGYPFLFLLAFTGRRMPWIAAFVILIGYWLFFALHPIAPDSFDWKAAGVPPDWPYLQGFAQHWEKNANAAAAFDQWLLNLFPREASFLFNRGGYQTLNFIPSLATMIFGLIAGRLLREEKPIPAKLRSLVIAGVAGIALGWAIDAAGWCPLVKRIWTPSWALFSTGCVALMLAAFVTAIDASGRRRWATPLVVAGLNPITLYVLWQLSSSFIRQQIRIHFGQDIFTALGETWKPLLERSAVLLVLWLIVWWMYRRKIFIRI